MSPRRSTHRRLDTEQQVQTVRKKSSPAEVMRHKKMRELIEVARARVPQKVDRRKPLIFIRSFGRAEKGLTTPDLLDRMVPKTWLKEGRCFVVCSHICPQYLTGKYHQAGKNQWWEDSILEGPAGANIVAHFIDLIAPRGQLVVRLDDNIRSFNVYDVEEASIVKLTERRE